MTARSNRLEVRNPVIALPSVKKLDALDETSRSVLRDILMDISTEAKDKAEVSWRKHKAPMAAYWKAVSVYTKHIARVVKRKS